jgi:hypothetical protein
MNLNEFIHWLYQNKEWVFSGIGVFLIGGTITIFLALYRKQQTVQPRSRLNNKLNTTLLKGTIHFAFRGTVREQQVFYPVPFKAVPYLRVQFIDGHFDDLEITEQRLDGFRIRVGGGVSHTVGRDIEMKWEAEGIIATSET